MVDLYLSPNHFFWVFTRVGLVRYDRRELRWMNPSFKNELKKIYFPWFYYKNGEDIVNLSFSKNEFSLDTLEKGNKNSFMKDSKGGLIKFDSVTPYEYFFVAVVSMGYYSR